MPAWSRVSASLRPQADDAPLVDDAPGMTLGQVLRRFLPRLRPMRWWLLLALLMLAAAPAIEIAEIWLFQRLVDDALVPAEWRPLIWLSLVFVGLNLVSAVVSGLDDYLTTWISQKFLLDLRTDLFRHVLSLPLHVHERRRLGDVMSRLTSDVAAVETFMVGHLAGGIDAVVRLLLFAGALLVLQWELALASFVVIPLFWWISTRFASFVRRLSRERRRRSGSLSAVTEEHLANGALVQAYHREDEAAAAYTRQNRAIFEAELAGSRVRALFLPLVDLTELLGTLIVVGMGVWALQTDRLTLGGLLAFLTLLAQCYRPVRDLADLLPSMYAATAGVERVVELLDEEPPRDRPDAVALVDPRGHVRLVGVTVRYPGAPGTALDRLDLEIRPGEIVALTGPSGAGKSTVVRLLTRHLDPDEGRVLVDGRPATDYQVRSLREAVTIVLQETMLLDASVADNIAFARPGATRAEVEAAARAADADEFVRALPQGYDTRVGQRGRSLSGGQRQRLALARALLRDTPVLILDEPTTGLDPESARRVLRPLREAARGRAVLLITHDPVAEAFADRTVRIERGRHVEPDLEVHR
ncbi:MAG TPA: ABC transporter ATP-binding protein [Nocardioides sp.]|uniref:ABC transporter ATP-binding protein n=1 Tax=Nocardioides sp. TaxID=35761 RepID=UPI002C2B7442|nr:ABC transporter ATP-binding protein [Nocardioides sp.]HTW18297.1 ABC transporter ATP-binding protein [Nocardioides sp.]